MVMSKRPSVSAETLGDGTLLLTLDGDFELAHHSELAPRLAAPLADGATSLVVDMRGVTFLDSKMLRMLLLTLHQAERRHERVGLIKPNPHVWRVLQVTGLDRLFPAYDCLREALEGAEGVHGR